MQKKKNQNTKCTKKFMSILMFDESFFDYVYLKNVLSPTIAGWHDRA